MKEVFIGVAPARSYNAGRTGIVSESWMGLYYCSTRVPITNLFVLGEGDRE